MKILLAGMEEERTARLGDALRAEGYEPSACSTIEEVRRHFERSTPSAIIVLDSAGTSESLSATRESVLRGIDEPDRTYLIGVVDPDQLQATDSLFESGFDDFVRRDVPNSVWVARIKQGERRLSERGERRRQHRASETARQETEKLLQKITDQIPGAVFEFHLTADGERQIPYISRGIEPLYGVAPEEAREDPSRMFEEIILKDDLEQVQKAIATSAETLEMFEQEFRIRGPEGIKWILVHSRPERRPDGSTVWYGMLRDITRRKQIERQLRNADRLASLGTLSAGIAHEINNPLAVILSNLHFVAGELSGLDRSGDECDPESEELQQAIGAALDASEHIREVVRGMYRFSAPEQPSLESVDLWRVVRDALQIVQHERRHATDLTIDLDSHVPAEGREAELVQVLVNLFLNAIQAMSDQPPETSELSIVVRSSDDTVVVEVADTGPGISDEQIDRIFDPFYTTKSVGEGTGLGLYVSHNLIESMNGEIEVDSLPGEGTTMRLLLRPADGSVETNGEGGSTATGDIRRTDRVLVITDEPETGIEMAETLEKPPRFAVATAVHRGFDTVLDARRYDAVIVDGTIRELEKPEARRRFDQLDENVAEHLGFLLDDTLSEDVGGFLEQLAYPNFHRPFRADPLETFVERLVAGTDAAE